MIRAARLNRWLLTPDGRRIQLDALLQALPNRQTSTLAVPAKDDQPARTGTLELRFTEVQMPLPGVLTPWYANTGRRHRCSGGSSRCAKRNRPPA